MDELEREWSVEDVMMAHGVLDALDEAEARAQREAREKAKAQR